MSDNSIANQLVSSSPVETVRVDINLDQLLTLLTLTSDYANQHAKRTMDKLRGMGLDLSVIMNSVSPEELTAKNPSSETLNKIGNQILSQDPSTLDILMAEGDFSRASFDLEVVLANFCDEAKKLEKSKPLGVLGVRFLPNEYKYLVLLLEGVSLKKTDPQTLAFLQQIKATLAVLKAGTIETLNGGTVVSSTPIPQSYLGATRKANKPLPLLEGAVFNQTKVGMA